MSSDVTDFKDSMDSKLNTLTQRLGNVGKSIASLQKSFDDQAKLQNIAFGLGNSHLDSFEYYYFGPEMDVNFCDNQNSSNLVKFILLSFRRGLGACVDNAALIKKKNDSAKLKKSQEDFHNKLINQIHGLIGTKPRIEFDSRKRSYVAYYSKWIILIDSQCIIEKLFN